MYMCVPFARSLAQDTGVTCCYFNHNDDDDTPQQVHQAQVAPF